MINILNNQIKFKEKHLMLHKTLNIDPKNFNQILKERKSKFCEYAYALKGSASSTSLQNSKSLFFLLKSLPSIPKRFEIKDLDKYVHMSFLSQEGFNYLNEVPKLNNPFLYKNSKLNTLNNPASLPKGQILSAHVINSETDSSLNVVKTLHKKESGQETHSKYSKAAIKKFSANKSKFRSSQSLINITEKVSISKPKGYATLSRNFSSLTFTEPNISESGKDRGSRYLFNFIKGSVARTFSTDSVKLEKDRGKFKDPNSNFTKDLSQLTETLTKNVSNKNVQSESKSSTQSRSLKKLPFRDKGSQKGVNFENFSDSKLKNLEKFLSKDLSPKASPSLNLEEQTVNTVKQFVPARRQWLANTNTESFITADRSDKGYAPLAFRKQLEARASKEFYNTEVDGRKRSVLEFRKRVGKNVSEWRGADNNRKDTKNRSTAPTNIYLSRFRGSIDLLENSKKGKRFQNSYEYQNESSYSLLQAKRMKISQINNLLKNWDLSWAKRKEYFVKLSNYTLVASDFTFLKNISNIRKIIDSKYKFDLFLSSSQSINYSFNKRPSPALQGEGLQRKIDLNSLYKFLKYTFSSISALISKPVYVHSPEKICISLFYFMKPKMAIMRKERKLKFLIRKKSESAKDQKHKNIFNKIMTKFKIKEFLANWKESNSLVRLASVSESNQVNNLLNDNPDWRSPSTNANIIIAEPHLSHFNLKPSDLLEGKDMEGKERNRHIFVKELNYSNLLNPNLFNSDKNFNLTSRSAPELPLSLKGNGREGLIKEVENRLEEPLTNTLFNLNNGKWAETNLLQFRANQMAHLILSTALQEIYSTATDTELASSMLSKLSQINKTLGPRPLDKGGKLEQIVAGEPLQSVLVEGERTPLLSESQQAQEIKTENFKLRKESIPQQDSLILSSNLYEEKFSYLISKLDSSVISYLFSYITKNNQLSYSTLNLSHKSDSKETIRKWLQKILSKSLKENLLLEISINPLENLILKTKDYSTKNFIESSKIERASSSSVNLDIPNHSHLSQRPLLDKSLSDTTNPELTFLSSERGKGMAAEPEKFESKLITKDLNHNLNEGFDNLSKAEKSYDFLTSLAGGALQSSSSSLLKLSDKDNFKNGFNSLQLLKFRDIPTMISLNDRISQYLVSNLEILFDKEVEVDLTRIRYPYHDSNILSQILKKSSYRKTFRHMMKNLLYTAIINNPTNLIRKQDFSIIPSYLSGIKVRLAGRISTQRVIPRFTVQSFQMGSLARGKVNYVETSRITHKNKRGAFSFTVTTSHFFENKKTKE